VTDLGTLGGLTSQAVAINDTGQVVGTSLTADGSTHAFLWSAAVGMLDLGTLGGSNSQAAAVNALGHVAGSADMPDGSTHAFLWTAATGMIDLGTLGGLNSHAVAMNDDDQVVGNSDVENGHTHAFSWTLEGGIVDLGTFGGNDFSQAAAVNGAGQVVGRASVPDGQANQGAFLWTAAGGLTYLGSLGPRGSFAVDINESGQVAGSSIIFNTNAFLWTTSGGIMNLGTLGNAYSVATAINNAGQIVGYSPSGGGISDHAFMWTRTTGIFDLGTLGGGLSSASAVNDAGQVVGSALAPGGGHDHAFLWTAADGMIDLGTLGGLTSEAVQVNRTGQVVGRSATADGNEHAALWEVTVPVDSTPPVVSIFAPAVVEATGPDGAVVSFVANAMDLEGEAGPVTCVPASGSSFPLGTTTITCSSSDLNSNIGRSTAQVTVRDTTPPAITKVTARLAGPARPGFVSISLAVEATDLVSARPICRITSVSSNEPGRDLWTVTGPLRINLAARRDRLGAARAYTIAVACRDAAGNWSPSVATTVVVPRPDEIARFPF
jgi:probable HAF family extracellular repeat protein